jgi:Bifunctional DNA primase/polymerase, N-terminal
MDSSTPIAVEPPRNELLDAALGYAAHGWRVIPLWWPVQTGNTPVCACPKGAACGRNVGKHPVIDDWPTGGTTDPDIINQWWRAWPSANIGILAGNGLVNIDIDPRNGGHLSLQDLEATYGKLPETPMVQTGGGGEHRLFATTETLPSGKLAPGIDFLADDHHQFVAAPSLHLSGQHYVWELSSHPEDIPLAPLPAWVAALARTKAAELAAAAITLPKELPQTAVDALTVSARMKALIRTGVPQGQRSEALWAVLKALVKGGYDDATIAGIVLDPANGISEKVLEQKNARSPRYWEMTRGWIAKEIARARAKPDTPWHTKSCQNPGTASKNRPGDVLDRTVSAPWWQSLLTQHGWTLDTTADDGAQHWRCPGQDAHEQPVGVLAACGKCFTVTHDATTPLQRGTPHSAFAALAFLDYGGNFRQAAHMLMVQQFAEAWPEAVDLLPLLEAQAWSPDVRAVFNAAFRFVGLDRGVWGACKRLLKGLLGDDLNLPDLEKAVKQARRTARTSAGASAGVSHSQTTGDNRPEIVIGPNIGRVVDESILAIQRMPGRTPDEPCLYQRARILSVVTTQHAPPKWLTRPNDLPIIAIAEAPHLRELAAKSAQWVKVTEDRNGDEVLKPALPPDWAIAALMARPGWPFPSLEGIVCSPTLRQDGSVLATPGYDPDTGLYLDFNGTMFPTVPETPTLQDARDAIKVLAEPFADFPFVASWHLSAALAAVCSVVARHAIPGNVPLFAVRSTTRGSGKGLIIDVISMLALGRQASRMAQTLDEEEERKRLLSIALDGTPLLHIDNVTQPLGSGPLDMALTAPTFGDRLLGKNVTKEAPMNAVFFASGNNMVYRGDLARRVMPIDLDPRMERPEERTDFAHSPLLPWVQEQRPRLLVAALTVLRAFCVAGRPAKRLKPWGSFEEWSDLVRQAIVWAGMEDPCIGRTDLEADSDPEYERLATLLGAWVRCYPKKEKQEQEKEEKEKGKTLAQVVGDIQTRQSVVPHPVNEWNELHAVLGDLDRRFDGKRLDTRAIGEVFRRFQGRTIDGKRLVKTGKSHQAITWDVETIDTPASTQKRGVGESGESVSPSSEKNGLSLSMVDGCSGEKKKEKEGERCNILVSSIEMTPLTPRLPFFPADSPEAVETPCPRCGEVTLHVSGLDGGLVCTWCSTLPDAQVFNAADDGEEMAVWEL